MQTQSYKDFFHPKKPKFKDLKSASLRDNMTKLAKKKIKRRGIGDINKNVLGSKKNKP